MNEKLTIYQQYMLEEIMWYIGMQPYIIICSDDNNKLDKCIEEILKRISSIVPLYEYPHLWGDYITPESLTNILTVEYKNIMLMNFDKMIEERINSNLERYNSNNLDNFLHVSHNIYDVAVWEQMIGYRDFLVNASIIVPCSNKSKYAYVNDLRCFAQVFCMDDAEKFYENESLKELKILIKQLKKIDYNQKYKDRIEKHLKPYSGRK